MVRRKLLCTAMDSRGRPRERERRPPGGHKERSRERNPARPAKHRSRTPTRTRVTPVRSSGSGLVRGRDRPLLQGARMDQEPSSRRPHDRDRSREREGQGNSKLRMDRDREHMGNCLPLTICSIFSNILAVDVVWTELY